MTDYNNPYHAVLEEIFDDLKQVCWDEIEEWHQEFTDVNPKTIVEMVNPVHRVTLELGRLTSISMRDGASWDLLGLPRCPDCESADVEHLGDWHEGNSLLCHGCGNIFEVEEEGDTSALP